MSARPSAGVPVLPTAAAAAARTSADGSESAFTRSGIELPPPRMPIA